MFERTVGLQTTNRKGELFQIGICGGCGYNVFLKFISSFRNEDRTKITKTQNHRQTGLAVSLSRKKETDKRTERNEIAWQQLVRMKVKKDQQKRKTFLRGQKKMLLLSMKS